jgi:hypothetical protein
MHRERQDVSCLSCLSEPPDAKSCQIQDILSPAYRDSDQDFSRPLTLILGDVEVGDGFGLSRRRRQR